MPRRDVIAITVFPLVSALVFVGYLVAVQPRLPAEVAIHWGPSGEADGYVSRGALPILVLGLSVIIGSLFAVVARQGSRAIAGRPLLGVPAGLVWFVGTLVAVSAGVQLDGGGSTLPGWAVGASVGAGLLGWAAGMAIAAPQRPAPTSTEPAPRDLARAQVPDGHTMVWTGRTPTARAGVASGVGVVVLGVILGLAASWWLLAIFVPVAALVVASSAYRVTIGRGLIDVSGFVFGFPRLRIPLAQVQRVEAGTVDAWSFGGWGIRVGAGNESAVLTRTGPALVVTRTDGATLRVSLDRPEEPAAVAATLLDLRS